MPRQQADKPTPKLLRQRNGWRVVWRRQNEQFSVTVPASASPKIWLARFTAALITDRWDPDLATIPAVRRWRGLGAPSAASGDAVDEFCATHGNVAPSRVRRYRTTLLKLAQFGGVPLDSVSPKLAAAYLDAAKAPATRNLHLVILKMFYRWAAKTRGWPNPVEDLRQACAARANTEIQYLSADEREEVLAAAAEIPHGIAVWLALLAGLRRNEVWRLEWPAVNFEAGTLVAQSKRGRVRTVPLSKRLEERLKKTPRRGAQMWATRNESFGR